MVTKEFLSRINRLEAHGPSSGGGGKSSGALDSAAVAALSGLRVLLIDVDRGNAALSDSLKPSYGVRVMPAKYEAGYASELMEFIQTQGIDLTIMDLGANVMTNSSTSQMVLDVFDGFASLSQPSRVYLNLQNAKRGIVADCEKFLKVFESRSEVFFNFRDGMDRSDFTDLSDRVAGSLWVPQYPTAIMAQLQASRQTPSDWIANPPSDFTLSAAIYAEQLLKRAKQPAFRDWIGSDAAETWLADAANQAPGWRYAELRSATDVTNEALKLADARLRFQARMEALPPSSPDDTVLTTARAFIEAVSLHKAYKRRNA